MVATGKVKPITKVEIKSGKRHHQAAGSTSTALLLKARCWRNSTGPVAGAGARAESQPARCAGRSEGARSAVEEERRQAGADVGSIRAYERARSLFERHLIAQSALDDTHSAVDVAAERKRAAQSQLAVSRTKVSEARARRWRRRSRRGSCGRDLANAIRTDSRHRADARCRIGSH